MHEAADVTAMSNRILAIYVYRQTIASQKLHGSCDGGQKGLYGHILTFKQNVVLDGCVFNFLLKHLCV